jgi:HAE1 family hydrophobic/amphiphilic exporter-1
MIFLAIVIVGAFAYTQVGIDLMPDFEVPVVTVITAYEGAGPQEVETRITERIEEQVSTVQNVDEVTSMSYEGMSMVTIRFDWGVDLAEATNDVRDKLDLVSRRLPEEAETPIIFKFNTSMIPVVMLGVTANESWEKLDKIVDKKIIDQLKRVPGVATAISQGGSKRGILCELDRERIRATGLTGRQIVNILRGQNLNNPGGHIRSGNFDYLVRTPEEFANVEEIGSVVVSNNPKPVRLKDVAEIKDGFLEKTGEFLMNGKPAMGIMVQKQSGANSVAVANSVLKAIPEIQAKLPSDVKLHLFFTTAEFIEQTITNLKNAVMVGGIAVFFVILFFLRDIRASIIVCTTIPTSLIITFLLMYLAGYTINQISLSSLAIGIGMVVDNAIVIMDNIKRYLRRSVSKRESAIWGAAEMAKAVIASTMTTIAIFLPIIFTTGITQIMFGQLASIVSMALIASLFSALVLAPMLCSKFLKPTPFEEQHKKDKIEVFLHKLENLYSGILEKALQNRLKTLGILCLLFLTSLGAIKLVGTDFIPEQDMGRMEVDIELPTGTRFEETGKIVDQIQQTIIKKVPELKAMVGRYGVSEDSMATVILGNNEASHAGNIELMVVPKQKRERGLQKIITDLRPELEKIPGAVIRFDTSDPLAGMMGAGGGGFSLNVYGYDLEAGIDYCNKLIKALEKVDGLKDLEISQKLAQPELQVIVDREKASNLGLNVTDIGRTVELYFNGDNTVKYREGGDEYDIEVRFREKDRINIHDLGQVPVNAPNGTTVKLSNVADIVQDLGPTRISRNEQERYIQITGQIYGRGSGEVAQDAAEIIRTIPTPPGFWWKFSGNEEERKESFLLMVQAAALGMLLVFMVMASQFESLLAPFIIFLSIPFGFMGGILALAITGFRISIVSLLGFMILIGIVVNNGIVLVSYINILIQRNYPLKKAIIEAGRSRLIPVLSTTLTTMLGMMPMVLSRGEGSEVWVPLALSVIGGLAVSSIMTLILMPVLYSLFSRKLIKQLGKV